MTDLIARSADPAQVLSSRKRLFLADLDSVRQGAAIPGSAADWTPTSVPPQVRGVLRMSILVGGQIVVPDIQLLDGRVFLALGPDGFGRLVSRNLADDRWPLEVCMRSADLDQSLVSMLMPLDRRDDRLPPFEFSVIDDVALRREVGRQLRTHSVAELQDLVEREGAAGGVTAMLARAGLPREQADGLAVVWQAWFDAQARFVQIPSTIPTSAFARWPGDGNYARARIALEEARVPDECFDALSAIADPDGDVTSRSRVYVTVLEPLRLRSPEHARGAEIIRSWVDAWYHRALSESMGADVLQSEVDSAASTAPRVWDNRYWLRINADIAYELGEMPSEVFAMLRYNARHDMPSWWTGGGRRARVAQRKLAHAMDEQTTRRTFTRLVFSGLSKVIVLMAAVFITGFDLHGWVKVIAFVAAALCAAGPELVGLWNLNPMRLDRRFSLSTKLTRALDGAVGATHGVEASASTAH